MGAVHSSATVVEESSHSSEEMPSEGKLKTACDWLTFPIRFLVGAVLAVVVPLFITILLGLSCICTEGCGLVLKGLCPFGRLFWA